MKMPFAKRLQNELRSFRHLYVEAVESFTVHRREPSSPNQAKYSLPPSIPMKIRHATPADAEAIAALHTSSWQLAYKNALSQTFLEHLAPSNRRALWIKRFASPQAKQYVLVVEDSTGLAGFACAYGGEQGEHGKRDAYLDNLHVGVAFQGKGLGRSLLIGIAACCAQHAPERGLYLSVNQDNLGAQHFYCGLGARNAAPGVWHTPDGRVVATFCFQWDSIGILAALPVHYSFPRLARTVD